MHELSKEAHFAGDWNGEPVRHVHVLAGILAFATEDRLLTMAHAFRADYTPIYAGDTLGRAALSRARVAAGG